MQTYINTRSTEGLPLGWERATDPKSQRTFFINHNTRETTWELPQNAKDAYNSCNPTGEPKDETQRLYFLPRETNIKQQDDNFYMPRPGNIYPNIFPQERAYQPSQEQYQPPGYPQFYPPPQMVKPSAPVLTESIRASQERLSAIKPRWNIPFRPDEVACARCQKQYRVLSKVQLCNCCMRKFCSGCTQKKAPVGEKGGEVCTVCDSCFRHISRGDTCCIPRLIPYIAEKSSAVRLDALRELLEAAENNDRKFITPDEFLPLSTVPVLKDILSPRVGLEEVEYTAGVLAKIVMAGTSSCGKPISLKKLACNAIEASNKYIDNGQNLSKLLSALAGTGAGKKALLDTRRAFRVLSKGLTGSSPAVVRNCTHTLRGLAGGRDDKADYGTDAESEFLILSSLSAILSSDSLDSSMRSDALSAADKLCYRGETKTFFCQSNGVSNVVHALAQGPPAPEVSDVKHGASILHKLASMEECAPVVAAGAEWIFGLCLNAKEASSRGALLQVIAKLTCNDSTKKAVADLVTARGNDFAAVFTGSSQAIETYGLRIVLCALSVDQVRARAALTNPGVINTLRRIATSKNPETQKAIEALAILDSSSLKNTDGLNEIIERFSKKEQSAIDAVVSITGELGTAGFVLENTKFIPALMQLVLSGEAASVQAGWRIISNLSTIPGFGATLYDSGAFKRTKGILTEGPAALQATVLRAMGQMCVADNMLTGSLISEGTAMKITELCGAPDADVQYAAIATCAEMVVCYPPFLSMFSRFGGVDVMLSTVPAARNDAIRERAIFALTCIVSICEPQNRHAYVRAISVLADALFSAAGPAQVHAAAGLGYFGEGLVGDTENALLDSGGILALATALGSENAELRKAACTSLEAILPRSQRCCGTALTSGALNAVVQALRSSEKKLLEPCLGVLGCLLAEEDARKEFCAIGGVDLLTGLCAQPPPVKDEAMNILMDLSVADGCALGLLNTSDLLAPLASRDIHMRYKALGVAASLARKSASVAHEIVDRNYLPYVLECFSDAPLNSPEMRNSLAVASVVWKNCGTAAAAPTQLTEALTPEQLLPVLASGDPETVTLALAILGMQELNEDKILPDLSTKEIVQNLCRAAVTETLVCVPVEGADKMEDTEDEGGDCCLEVRDDTAPKTALYILMNLVRKYPDATGPHLCQKDAVPYLFAHMGDSSASRDMLDFFVGILLPALRQEKELRKAILKRRHAHRGIDALLLTISSNDSSLKNKGAKALSVLAGAQGNAFTAAAERAEYTQVAESLVAATREGSQITHMLLTTLCALLKSEGTHKRIAEALDFETLRELVSARDNSGTSSLALSVVGTLSCSNAFRAAQEEHAQEWAELFCSLLEGPLPPPQNEDAAARNIAPIVGLAPARAFREAFAAEGKLVSHLIAAATNTYMPRAQTLAIRCIAMLGIHSAAGAILDAAMSHPYRSASVLSETLRFCASLEREELCELFRSDVRYLAELWGLRKINATPASLFSLVAVCTALAENEEIRDTLAQTIDSESLREVTESYPYIADHVAVLQTYLGV